MDEPLDHPARAVFLAWAAKNGLAVEWLPDAGVTHVPAAAGMWRAISKGGRQEDWTSVHPIVGTSRAYVELVAGAGNVDVYEVDPAGLRSQLDGALASYASWESFMASGPGRGH